MLGKMACSQMPCVQLASIPFCMDACREDALTRIHLELAEVAPGVEASRKFSLIGLSCLAVAQIALAEDASGRASKRTRALEHALLAMGVDPAAKTL